ncbi:MAG: arsenite methyltransferase [Bacillota bacterium]
MNGKEETRELVRKRYGDIASNSSEGCGCGSGCCCSDAAFDIREASKSVGYDETDLDSVPMQANMGLGCGNPVAIAGIREGDTVLDLGSGGGFDCFLAARRAGETGRVIGVDMTPEMIKLSRSNVQKIGYTNVEFRLGEIEHLPVADGSVDVIISNCVINLSPEKQQVFHEAFRVLKHGGRISVSDVVATAELPADVKGDLAMLAGCIAGAEHTENIRRMLENAGFMNIRMTPKDNSREIIKTWVPDRNVEDFVASYIIEAEKP